MKTSFLITSAHSLWCLSSETNLKVGIKSSNVGKSRNIGVVKQRCAESDFSTPTALLYFKTWLLFWYDSWLQKNYRLLILFNLCHKLRRMQIVNANLKNTMIKTHSYFESYSNRKNPVLILLCPVKKCQLLPESTPVLRILHS